MKQLAAFLMKSWHRLRGSSPSDLDEEAEKWSSKTGYLQPVKEEGVIPGADLVHPESNPLGIAAFAEKAVFALSAESSGDQLTLRIHGEADVYAVTLLRDRLVRILDKLQVPDLVVDFTYCTYLDSTGLGIILGMNKQMRDSKRRMRLANLPQRMTDMFRITKLDELV